MMDTRTNGALFESDGMSSDEEELNEDAPPIGMTQGKHRSSAPPLPPLCPASLLLQAAAGLEAMTTYRAAVAAATTAGGPLATKSTSPPNAPPTPTDSSPPLTTTPRSDQHNNNHHQQLHRGPQPISPPPPSPQISAAELSLLTEASATTNGTFQCTLCSKQFGYKNGLIRHVRLTHVGEKPYQCTICNRRFGYKHILMEHQNLHFGNRPYACALCDKRFAARSNLIQHRMVHRRPYNCTMCSKRFDREDQLKKHMFAHPQSHQPPGGDGSGADIKPSVGLERSGRRRVSMTGAAMSDMQNEFSASSPPTMQVHGGSGTVVGGYGSTEDDGSWGRPADDDDSAGSRGSSSPEPEDYAKALSEMTSPGSLMNASKMQFPGLMSSTSLTGHRIDAICSQLSTGVGSSVGGTSMGNQHFQHQRHPNHHHEQQLQQHQQQSLHQHRQLVGGLFPGVVIKKEQLDEGGVDQYGGQPMELNARRHSSPRGANKQNGVEMDVDRSTGHHHVGSSAGLSSQYPLTSFASWPSPGARYSSGSGPLSSPFSAACSDTPLTVAIGCHSHSSSACSSSSALPGIHEVFSRRPGGTASGSSNRLPSFANFMPLSVAATAANTVHTSPATSTTVATSSGGHQTTSYKGLTLPDIGMSIFQSPTNMAPVAGHHLSNGAGGVGGGNSQPQQQQQQQQSGVVNPTPRPTAQLPPIALQPLATASISATTPPRPTKDQGVQHSQSVAGFPSLEDVLSYYVSQGRLFRCQHCSILFFERGMYFLHASLHGLTSPWECSICHRVCSDKNEFTLHFVNQQHNC